MGEFRRVLTSRKVLGITLLILCLNLLLFLRQQQNAGYGFDGHSVDAEQVLASYAELLDTYRYADYKAAEEEVREKADMAALYENIRTCVEMKELILSSDDGEALWRATFGAQYDHYVEHYPELVESIAGGMKWDETALQTQSAAAMVLLGQLEHLNGYDDYLAQIKENRDKLYTFSIFNQKDSFSNRNIEKTAADFAVLESVELRIGADRAITSFFNYQLTDYFLLLLLSLVALSFLDERRQGLWQMIHAAPMGRASLALKRVGILAVTALVGTVLLCGSILTISLTMYGGWADLGRAIQSIHLFKTLPLVLSTGGMVLHYLGVRAASAFVLGLFVWLFLTVGTNLKYTLAVLVVFLGIEYSLYTFLPVQSLWTMLKYFNVFSYIDLSALYTQYLNLNVFGRAVGIRALTVGACLPLAVMLGGACVFLSCKRRPRQSKSLFASFALVWSRCIDRGLSRCGLLGYEVYKSLWLQRGILVLAVLCILLARTPFSVTVSHKALDDYAQELQGEVTDETWNEIDALRTRLQAGVAELDAAAEQYRMGELDFETYYNVASTHAGDAAELQTLDELTALMAELELRGEALGRPLWLVNERPYRSIYGDEALDQRMEWWLLTLFAMALLFAGSMTAERNTKGLRQLLQATPRGRKTLLGYKYLFVCIVTTLLWGVATVLELAELFQLEPEALVAPVQSLSFLRQFPLGLNIVGFLALLYLARWVMLLCCSSILVGMSALCRRLDASILLACGVMVLPTALWKYLGIDLFGWISLCRGVDVMGLLTEGDGVVITVIPMVLTLLLLSGVSTVWCYRRCR